MRPNFEGFGSIGDLFEAFFGPAFGAGFAATHPGPLQGEDAIVGVEIDLEQAAAGESVERRVRGVDPCARCDGDGAEPGTTVKTCERCAGAGVVQMVSRSPFGQVMRTAACDVCAGQGQIPESPCKTCDGRGRVVRPRTLRVDIPAGIDDGQRIRIAGSGHAGERGGPPGDLYVQVRVREHDRLLRDGDDLVTVLDVPAPLAALGADLDGAGDRRHQEVQIPTGTQPGEVIVMRGEGMPELRRVRPPRRPARRRERRDPAPADRRAARAARRALRVAHATRTSRLRKASRDKLRRLFGGQR